MLEDADTDSLIAAVEALPYHQRRAYLGSVGYSRFIYKYRTLDPDNSISIQRARSIVLRNELWLGSPLSFNDPFDMSAKLELAGSTAEWAVGVDDYLSEQGAPAGERAARVAELTAMEPSEIIERLRTVYMQSLGRMRVCSFAGDPRSILMWSHYASSHEGYCIGYERACDARALMQALPVQYSEDYPVVLWNGNFSGSEELNKVLLRKSIGWAYEKESRVVDPDGASTSMRVAPEAMKFLILGCRMKKQAVAVIRDVLGERRSGGMPAPRLLRAKPSASAYALSLVSAD